MPNTNRTPPSQPADDTSTVCITLTLPLALKRSAKVRAAETGTTVSAIVTKLLTEHLVSAYLERKRAKV